MHAAVPCPTADDLAQFIAGGVGGAQLDTLEAHVDACSDCRQSLAAAVRGQAAQAALGRYRVDGILGAGGMGIVYRAFDPELRRPVAIKVVRPGPEEGMVGLRARLGREAEAMARLSHRNVCHVYDLGSDGDELWIAMELVEGTSMRPWMLAQPGATAIANVIGQAADGLGAAHAVGLCHRDVKPDNILVEPGGRAVLTDFGLARQLDVGTRSTVMAGTLAYMAPEVLEGGVPDARSDQYALAITAHEALTGVRPRHGVVASTLAPAVRQVLGRGLASDPATRFPSVVEFGAALRTAIAPGQRRTSRVALGVAAGAVLAAAAITGVVVWRGGDHPTAPITVAEAPTPPNRPTLVPIAPPVRGPNTAPPIIVGGGGGGSSAPISVGSAAGSAAGAARKPVVIASSGSGGSRATGSGSGATTSAGSAATAPSSATTDMRPIAAPANRSAVDAWAQWRLEYKAARAQLGDTRVQLLQATPVGADGKVNLTRDRGMVATNFVAAKAKLGVPSDKKCGVSRSHIRDVSVETDVFVDGCVRWYAFPRCTIADIWARALAAGADASMPANITYYGSWGFRQGATDYDFKDDCGVKVEAIDAAGSGSGSGSGSAAP